MIYGITMCTEIKSKISDRGNHYLDRDYQVAGYYKDEKRAVDAVLKNQGGLSERRYVFAVIEIIAEGISPRISDKDSMWFKWDDIKQSFEACKKPDDLNRIKGFFIG